MCILWRNAELMGAVILCRFTTALQVKHHRICWPYRWRYRSCQDNMPARLLRTWRCANSKRYLVKVPTHALSPTRLNLAPCTTPLTTCFESNVFFQDRLVLVGNNYRAMSATTRKEKTPVSACLIHHHAGLCRLLDALTHLASHLAALLEEVEKMRVDGQVRRSSGQVRGSEQCTSYSAMRPKVGCLKYSASIRRCRCPVCHGTTTAAADKQMPFGAGQCSQDRARLVY